MYTIYNIVEDKNIIENIDENRLTHFIRNIAVENGDEELSITCVGEAIDYVNNYCSNLTLIKE